MIRFEDVKMAWRSRVILDQVSGTLQGGRVTALVGRNGAGKSSLLGVLHGERSNNLESGTVTRDDRALTTMRRHELAMWRAVLPQHASLSFPLTVEDVVALGRAPHALRSRGLSASQERALVLDALARVGLRGRELERYDVLSGGERQRVHLARTLAQLAPLDESLRGKWLFLDEPTASQDMAHAHHMLELVRDLAGQFGLGVCVVLHDLNLVMRYTHDVIVLEEGRVVASGETSQVIDEDLLARVFRVRARRIDGVFDDTPDLCVGGYCKQPGVGDDSEEVWQ